MPAAAKTTKTRRGVGLAGATIGVTLLFYWLQPIGLMPFDDEFGYFKSMLLTFQHGYPRAHDWLEPWAASLSALAAFLLLLTGSFAGVVIGMKVVGATAAFLMIVLLLRQRTYPLVPAIVVAFALVTTPTLLWKWTEFSTLLLYVPCLIAALLAAERRCWWLFFLLWTVAFSSRQSAIVWLVVPIGQEVAAALAESGKDGDRPRRILRAIAPLLPWLAFSAVVAIAMPALMNRTHSQSVVTYGLLGKFQPLRFVEHVVVGCGGFVVAIGLGALALALSRDRPLSWPRRGPRLAVAIAAATICVLLVTLLGFLPLSTNGWSYGRAGTIYIYVLLLLSLTGWACTDFTVNRSYLGAAALFSVLLGFRVLLPDYHLIDIAAFGFFAALPGNGAAAGAATISSRLTRPIILACFAALLALHLHFGIVAKVTVDVFYGRTVLAEKALRRGDLTPAEILFAPIGYAGWKLHPYFLARDQRNTRMIAGYLSYLEGSVIAHERPPSATGNSLPPENKIVARGFFPVAFAPSVEFLLVRQNEQIVWTPQLREMQRMTTIFPLDDAEWWALATGAANF